MARTIVVTGGATGIGRATAERFRADGDDVVITGRRGDVLTRTADELGAKAIVCDAADPAQVAAFAEQLPGRIDVLVNNAGGNTDLETPAAGDDLQRLRRNWLANYEANVLSAVLTTSALAARLTTAVIHLGSIAGTRGGGSYGAAKSALATWSLEVAAELGPRGVTSNVVAPGYTADTEFFRDQLTDERRTWLLDSTMTKRAGTPADVAAVIHFVASPQAGHVTGQVLHVNGGALTTR
ncbi:short-chain dehydrogenase/reductase SDR [Kribbella flavida DSM 17836]|uniref:Short-chain dehydrogenase/reductase SDR n=1 Tax=Kribbella flavida (strain DSM 17836 / JCM 10339 / NBRC 14399) TaxID=479435 RepID=D2PMR0_KRIFD|nr:SDR family oxidoreductase [Kribbella flavida]ADB32612.1 short-chain dehydrogenase/reductase SDR [Kribbella flavida DSM 17836]